MQKTGVHGESCLPALPSKDDDEDGKINCSTGLFCKVSSFIREMHYAYVNGVQLEVSI